MPDAETPAVPLAEQIACVKRLTQSSRLFRLMPGTVPPAEVERDKAALRAVLATLEGLAWRPIETAPRDRLVLFYAPPDHGLPAMRGVVQWHEDAGFCVDELRQATHWMPLPEPPDA